MAALRKKLALTGTLCALLAFPASSASEQAGADPFVDQFFALCGGNGIEALERLPGVTVGQADIPSYFASDVERSGDNYRVTQTDLGYAMRAVMRAGGDPNAILVKCAFAANVTTYDQALAALAAAAGTAPLDVGNEGQSRRAMFAAANAPYQIFEEVDGWISIYRIDIMISARGISREYLREGAQPVPIPPSQ